MKEIDEAKFLRCENLDDDTRLGDRKWQQCR